MAGERGSDEAFVQFSAMADTLWLAMVAISTPPSWEAGSAVAAKCACIVGGQEHEQTHLLPDILTVDEAVTEDVEFFVKCDVNFINCAKKKKNVTSLRIESVQQECQRASSCHRVYKYEEFAATRPASQV
ncbi:hypothetical protein MGG_09609 [Pyricularia oryzae 70-15]|uniref:Uncharacterized protein n=1 Tax=Pyricularia oryzae (strain 70-15 / ATCC MYA-4617 / FGSC 8958) TaxID=242507 RepID=G4NL91_PYRO7|nr:uncharacterized protein MGG_09609 [Pyricularia oryzae 70-15]EHA46736.1 hypothetical protein MGG_09609 [Pyricularia oryzae 70-15]